MATEISKVRCGACHHLAEDHVNGKCCTAGCYCTARFGEPLGREAAAVDQLNDSLEEIGVRVDRQIAAKEKLKEEVQRLSVAAKADAARINKLTAEVALLTERAADLREMLAGERARAELFKDECQQWRRGSGLSPALPPRDAAGKVREMREAAALMKYLKIAAEVEDLEDCAREFKAIMSIMSILSILPRDERGEFR